MSRESLKVAIVRPYLTTKKGGAERYAVELIRGLNAAGHRVHAFAHEWDTPEEPGVVYTRVAMPRKPAWLRVLAFHFYLRRRLRFADFDAVLGMTPFWPQRVCWLGDGLYRVWVRIAWPVPIVRWIMCLKRAVMTVNLWMEKKMLAPPTAVFIANSHLVARQARQLYGVPKERIEVVYPWIDARRFNPAVRERWRDVTRRSLDIRDDEMVLLFAGNNFKRKGLDLTLSALAKIDRGGAPLRLIVVGSGKISRYRRKTKKLGLGEVATFVGAVGDLERYYAAADLFILPTQYDPCATVCLEALACGLPVITSAMNGAAEFVDNGRNGFVVDADATPDSLARSIQSLASLEWRAGAGAQAFQPVRQLTTAAHLQQIIAALQTVARSSRKTVPMRVDPALAVNEEFAPLLQRNGLNSFSAFRETPRRTEFEYNQGKRMSLLEIDDHGSRRYLYLKYHRRRRSRVDGLLAALGRPVPGAGAREWQNILDFQSAGLPAAEAVAVGERRLGDGSVESFLATWRLDGYRPLDDYIATRLAPPFSTAVRGERRRIIGAVAQLARRMHALAFNHRDFYLCHIFARTGESGLPDLRVIDLQRVGRRMFPFRRWRVKDLAQLHYSTLGLPISDRDRLRFFAAYSPLGRRRRLRRHLLRQVLRKSRSIARHDARLRVRSVGPMTGNGLENNRDLAKISSRHD